MADDNELEDLLEEASNRAPASQVASLGPISQGPAPVRQPAVMPPAPDVSGSVATAIKQRYGFDPSLDAKALEGAQRQAATNNLVASLGEASSNLANAISGSNVKQDPGVFNALRAQADQPVQDILQERKAKIEDEAAKRNQENMDPNSVKAEIMRKQLTPLAQSVGLDPQELKNLSIDDLKQFTTGPLEFAAKLKEQQQVAADRRLSQENVAKERSSQKQTADAEKLDQKQQQAYTNLRKDLESFRGNAVVRQADMDQYSAAKALSIVKNKDPNTLTTQDLSLLSGELAKIATGGVPTEHGMQSLMPNNLQTKLAEMQNFLTSKPSNAQAGEYIKKNMAYLNEMVGESKKVVDNYRKNIAAGYKNRVRPQDYQEAMTDYGLGPQAQPAAPVPQGQGQAPAPVSVKPHPQDSQAIQWAKQNPNDPFAAKILQANGVANAGL